MHLRPLLEQVGGLGAGCVDNVVDMHLVQADCGLLGAEELLADGGEVELGV